MMQGPESPPPQTPLQALNLEGLNFKFQNPKARGNTPTNLKFWENRGILASKARSSNGNALPTVLPKALEELPGDLVATSAFGFRVEGLGLKSLPL